MDDARTPVTPARTPAEWRRLIELAEDAGRGDLADQARTIRRGGSTRRDPVVVESLVLRSAAAARRLYVAPDERASYTRRAEALESLWRGDIAA